MSTESSDKAIQFSYAMGYWRASLDMMQYFIVERADRERLAGVLDRAYQRFLDKTQAYAVDEIARLRASDELRQDMLLRAQNALHDPETSDAQKWDALDGILCDIAPADDAVAMLRAEIEQLQQQIMAAWAEFHNYTPSSVDECANLVQLCHEAVTGSTGHSDSQLW